VALEIVSVDSAQVYRGLDIGAAKPGAQERARVPHHLLDLRDPGEPYSAADFVRDANQAIDAIARRGRLPLVVGGTMLYARALREGLASLPSADAALRARLAAEARAAGWPALHARLAAVDPVTAARLPPNDSQRIQRALEVFELSGRPLSALLETSPKETGPNTPSAPAIRTIALMPGDRAELHRRIEARFDAMLAAGFLDEVRALRSRFARGDPSADSPADSPADWPADWPALRSVGYRQAWAHLDGATSFAEFRAAAIAATRRLAKRQMTWLRAMNGVVRIDPFDPRALAEIRAVVGAAIAAA
jgi:tRNA dimethylallyltransferase